MSDENFEILFVNEFSKGFYENPKFWKRLGGMPSFSDSTVLDIGCGLGSLCIEIAKSGAKKVVGIDIDSKWIEFAKQNLILNYPEFLDKIDFVCSYLEDYPKDKEFDFIFSKNAFEHIIDLKGTFEDMLKRLKIGGSIYIGFGPLWYSPFGDHKRTEMMIPWGHLLMKESSIIKKLNKKRNTKINSFYDLGLNLFSPEDYEKIIFGHNLNIVYYKTNVSDNPFSKILSIMAKIPFLNKYFIHNIYCIVKNEEATR